MQLGSVFIINCNNTLHVSDAICFHPQEHFLYTIWLSSEDIDLGRSYWILHPMSCQTPDAVTTVFKRSWGWKQIASETCRVLLHLLINILPSCITLVLYIYILTYDGRKIKDKMKFHIWAFFANLSRKFQFHYNLTTITGTLHEADRYTFLIISRLIPLRMRNISEESCRENQNTRIIKQLSWKIVPFIKPREKN
jgi:hypothetical protein